MFESQFAVKNDSLYAPLTQDGNIFGVGVNLALVHNPPLDTGAQHYTYINVVDTVEPNTPAEKAGLLPGDVIVEVNGSSLDYGRQLYLPDEVAEMIRGPEGSKVIVVVERNGGARVEFVLNRKSLPDVVASSAGSSWSI